ncbi:ribonuclease H-like domain-containing protein [bacterium]|nr:ribonuclease H-like domain-containing protein [bacterium]
MKYLILDIETRGLDPLEDEITCIGVLKLWNGNATCFLNEGLKDSEGKILKNFWDEITKETPDFLVGWNIDNFDWRFLKIRSLIKGVKISKYYKKRERIDLMHVLRTPKWRSLESYASALSIIGKMPYDPVVLFETKDFYNLKKYNKQDLEITAEIFKRCLKYGLVSPENENQQIEKTSEN